MIDKKLGKLPARFDARTLKLSQALQVVIPPIPSEWDYDNMPTVIPQPMFVNDELGCCVISSRGHQTLRFENTEQAKILPISDVEIRNEYFRESGGMDEGIVMLDSMTAWRKRGWAIGENSYNIYAFASIHKQDHQEVKTAIYLFTGIQVGIQLPERIMKAFEYNIPWDAPYWWAFESEGRVENIIGGHCVYLHGYDPEYLYGTTWGRSFRMTWKFWDRYVDEAYVAIDNRDKWVKDSPLDVQKLEQYLKCL